MDDPLGWSLATASSVPNLQSESVGWLWWHVWWLGTHWKDSRRSEGYHAFENCCQDTTHVKISLANGRQFASAVFSLSCGFRIKSPVPSVSLSVKLNMCVSCCSLKATHTSVVQNCSVMAKNGSLVHVTQLRAATLKFVKLDLYQHPIVSKKSAYSMYVASCGHLVVHACMRCVGIIVGKISAPENVNWYKHSLVQKS